MAATQSRKKSTLLDSTDQYVRDCCADLDGEYDRAAVRLLCTVGVFETDTEAFSATINRLRATDMTAENAQGLALEERVVNGATGAARQTAFCDLEDYTSTQISESVEAAYMLGIAMGRRIASQILPGKAGKR